MDLAHKGLDIFHNMEPVDIDPRADILLSAAGCILSDRTAAYGPPEDNFANIVNLWNVYLAIREQGPKKGLPLDGTDQGIMMVLMKVARLAANPGHQDSYVDAAGYLGCAWRCEAAAQNAAVSVPVIGKIGPASVYDRDAVQAFMADFSELPATDDDDGYRCGCSECSPQDWPKQVVSVLGAEIEQDGDITLWPAPGGMTYGEAKQTGKDSLFNIRTSEANTATGTEVLL